MTDPQNPVRPLVALRSRGLKGRFRVPGEPAAAALTLLLAALARGETVVYADTGTPAPDVAAALRLVAAAGARADLHDDRWHIEGLGPLGLLEPLEALEFGGAGRALPLAMGLLAPYGFSTALVAAGGAPEPVSRPLGDALRAMGVVVEGPRTGYLPLTFRGPRTPVPFDWRAPAEMDGGAVAALLLAGLGLPGRSALRGVRDVPGTALALLRHFGAELEMTAETAGTTLAVGGLPRLGARTLVVAGDPDVAALAMVAALTVPESDVVIENVPLGKPRRGVLDTLLEMGGAIETVERRHAGGEDVADLRVRHSPLLGTGVGAAGLTPSGIAPLAVAAAFAAGETQISRFGFAGETELHQRLAAALAANGAQVRADRHGLTIARPPAGARLGGGTVESGDDAMLAAAFLVMGLGAPEQVTLADERAMNRAYPELVASFESLGAQVYRRGLN